MLIFAVLVKVTSELEASRAKDGPTLHVNMAEQSRNNGQSQNVSHDTSFSKLYIVSQVRIKTINIIYFYYINN